MNEEGKSELNRIGNKPYAQIQSREIDWLFAKLDEEDKRIAALETQLAEERAKREAAEEVCETWKSRHAIVKERADKAERELAEMRQILLDKRVQATKGAWAASEMQKRVEGLQALVDAATPSVEIRAEQFVHVNGQFIVQEKPIYARGIAGRLRIALARDLAAKEKEPK